MSTPAAIRHINQTRLLHALRANGPMSRAEIARELKMMRSTAGNLVETLLQEDYLRLTAEDSDSMRPRDVGRPGMRVELNPVKAHFLGADVGVGYVRVVLTDLQSTLVGSRHAELGRESQTPDEAARVLCDLVTEALDSADAHRTVQGLRVSVPGLVDHDGGVRRAPILGWNRVPFLDLIRARLPQIANIRIENDANAFALAELLRRDARRPNDVLFLWLDAGVGGAIFADGKLQRGGRGYAGEFGHVYVGENDIETGAPIPGSLESFIGRDALLQRFRHFGGRAQTLADFAGAVEGGDPVAARCLGDWSRALARGLSSLASAFDPERIVIGGPLASLLHLCLDDTRKALGDFVYDPRLAPELVVSDTGPEGAAIGCALSLGVEYLELDEGLVFGRLRPE